MKQTMNTISSRSHNSKKTLLPSFRHSRQMNKLQEINVGNKTQITFHAKLIPFDLILETKIGSAIKCMVSCNELTVSGNGETYKIENKFAEKEWINIVFGVTCPKAKIRKIGDQNALSRNLFFWKSPSEINEVERKINDIISVNLSDTLKDKGKPVEDKNSQMKKFVATMMARKNGKKCSEGHSRNNFKRNPGIVKTITTQPYQQDSKSIIWKNPPPSTTGSGHSHSFKKDFLQSKFLPNKIEKSSPSEIRLHHHGSLIHQKSNLTLNFSVDAQEYVKRKNKFDSQPYFYKQTNILESSVIKKQKETIEQKDKILENKIIQRNNLEKKQKCEEMISCLENQSLHQSQQEQSVEQSIHRSELVPQLQFSEMNKKQQKQEESSQCFESKSMLSSGTIYESRYE